MRQALCAAALSVWSLGHGAASADPVALPTQDGWNAARQHVITADGIDLAYVELGEAPETATGLPVILIHGYTDNSRSWSLVAPTLRKDLPGRRIIAFDLRGHGASDAPSCCYGPDSLAHDIGGALDALQIARADVVGHSLGSMTTAFLAATQPARVNRIVLTSVSTSSPPEATAWLWENVPALPAQIDPNSQFMLDWYANPTPVSAEFLTHERAESAAVPHHVWMGVLQALTVLDWSKLAPRIEAPTAILWGDQDGLFGPETQEKLRKTLPKAEFHQFDGLGHNFFWEQPEQAGEIISTFLKG